MRYDHHLPSWLGDDWHSVALAPELISSSATAMDALALVTRASLAAWSARRAPSSRTSLSAARPLRLVLFFGVVPACMADILYRLRRSRPSMVAVSTMCSGWNTIRMMCLIRNPMSHAFCDESIVLRDLKTSHALFRTDPAPG